MEQLTVTKIVAADRERVFAAWVDPEKLLEWWGAGDVRCPAAEIDLRVGGRYRIANETPDGQLLWISGSYLQVDPPKHLEYTWTMDGGPDTDPSVVNVHFEEVAQGTKITVVQTRIADRITREIHLEGWVGCLDGLVRLLT